jgi:hypothetical protein
MAMLDFDPVALPRLLARPEPEQNEAANFLAKTATAVPGGRAVGPALLAALLDQLD